MLLAIITTTGLKVLFRYGVYPQKRVIFCKKYTPIIQQVQIPDRQVDEDN